jgi:hypothetical protein
VPVHEFGQLEHRGGVLAIQDDPEFVVGPDAAPVFGILGSSQNPFQIVR